jgi:hypothetical protein
MSKAKPIVLGASKIVDNIDFGGQYLYGGELDE